MQFFKSLEFNMQLKTGITVFQIEDEDNLTEFFGWQFIFDACSEQSYYDSCS